MQLNSLNDVFTHEIQDLRSAETQLVDALPKTATGRLQKGRVRESLSDPARWWDGEAS